MALVDESDTSNMILRTVFLPPALDDRLRDVAFAYRMSKGDLIRQLVVSGLNALESGSLTQPTPTRRSTSKSSSAPKGVRKTSKPRPSKKKA